MVVVVVEALVDVAVAVAVADYGAAVFAVASAAAAAGAPPPPPPSTTTTPPRQGLRKNRRAQVRVGQRLLAPYEHHCSE